MQLVKPREIIVFQDDSGKEPFTDWLGKLKDEKAKIRILDRLKRLKEFGAFGDSEPVGKNIFELRVFIGAGYRVYAGNDGDKLVIILCGGDKSTQREDIKQAKIYWRIYNERKNKN
jgi:putative addiction module killer protein